MIAAVQKHMCSLLK